MADRIRFHFDEHVDPAIAVALRREIIEGLILIYEVLTPAEMEGHAEYLP